MLLKLISSHCKGLNELKCEMSTLQLLLDKVILDCNMLAPLVKHRVLGQLDS